jgi:signal transduction histidine kinase
MNDQLNIVLLEDNVADARLIELMLHNLDQKFKFECIDNLEEGIEMIHFFNPDVILSDLNLTDSHSLGTIESLLEHFSDIPIIAMTGMGHDEIGMNAINIGAQDFLEKGFFDEKQLSRAIYYSIERMKLKHRMESQKRELEIINTALKIERNKTNITLKELEQFAYVASHDLRSPIGNIASIIELIVDNPLLPEDVKPHLDLVSKCANQLVITIANLGDALSYKQSIQENVREIHPHQELENIMTGLAKQARDFNAQVNIHCEKEIIFKYIPSHFRSILQNLIQNSIKYQSSERPAIVNVNIQKINSEVHISVEDNGVGISEGKENIIFGLFDRIETEVEGKGMGLYVTKSLIDSLEGEIRYESTKGNGTTFYVILKEQNIITQLISTDENM